jgi:hypothetical protein
MDAAFQAMMNVTFQATMNGLGLRTGLSASLFALCPLRFALGPFTISAFQFFAHFREPKIPLAVYRSPLR